MTRAGEYYPDRVRTLEPIPPPPKPYDWRKSAWKVLKNWLITVGSVAGLALVAFAADLENTKRLLEGIPGSAVLAVLIQQAAATWLMDYQKHKTPEGQE